VRIEPTAVSQLPMPWIRLGLGRPTRGRLLRCLGERAAALLATRWMALDRITLCPKRIGSIISGLVAGLVVDGGGVVETVARPGGSARDEVFRPDCKRLCCATIFV